MKIAVFIKRTTFHQGHGGLETQNQTLCEGLAKRGHQITVFSPKKELKSLEAAQNGVNYVFIPCVFRTLFVEFIKNHWYKESVRVFEKYHQKSKFDLAISQSSAGVGIVQNKKRLEIPVVSISHGTIIGEIKTRLQNNSGLKDTLMLIPDVAYALYNFFVKQRNFILGSNRVVAVSSFVREKLLEETYASEDKIVVINNGVDFLKMEKVEPRVFDDNKKHAFFIGRIEISKGVLDLVDTFSEQEFRNYRLDLAGTGPYDKKLKNHIEKKGLGDRINLMGRLEYQNALQMFKSPQVKVFLFPTKRVEGFPMTIVEAMFAGLPVVAYNMGGVFDAVENEKTGFLVKPDDLHTFKQRTLEILQNDDLRQKLSEQALLKAKKEFSIDVMLDKYEQVFKEVVK